MCRKTSKFLQVGIIVFDGSGPICPKYPNRKLVILLQYLKKSIATALCSVVMHNIHIFYGGPVMLVDTCSFFKLFISFG